MNFGSSYASPDYNAPLPQWPGLSNGIYYGQFQCMDEINQRILARDQSDKPLPPNFDPRPVLTKYALFPMLDNRMPATVPIQANYNYSLEKNFTPPLMSVGPVSGFINNVEVESNLRNQFFALQKGAGQNVYIPSSNSDLYKVHVTSSPNQPAQPFPGLFDVPAFQCNPNQANLAKEPEVGRDIFHNGTRNQLRVVNTEHL